MSFCSILPALETPQTAPSASSEENSMRLYSEAEITTLIEEITDVATEAIEKAAGEAARAALY
jgi:hypothetical protein